jgi:dTDP-4-amino-4,6-dideoxygalactose transaminase
MAEPIALFGGKPTLAKDAHKKWPDVSEEQRRAILRVLDRGVLSGSNAPESVAFEEEFADFVGAKYALLAHSGTSALHLALAAAGIQAGDHVIVPAYSFVATPLAVLHAGGIPIFADVDETTGLIDPKEVESLITSRVRAVMPVHVHGCSADLGALFDIAKRHNISIIEDAAQAHGATWNGKPVGALGKAGGFSLQSSKNLGAGEGGVFVTNDEGIAEEANRLRNFGQNVALADRAAFDGDRPLDALRSMDSSRIGWMYRGNELGAAFARTALEKLPELTRLCQENAAWLSAELSKLPGVLPPTFPEGATSVHHKYRVRLDAKAAGLDIAPRALREVMIKALRAEGLEVVLWQQSPLPAQPTFITREGFGGGFPWSLDRDTDFASLYALSRFSRTQRLLDGSLLLFSQSCPLIAQPSEIVHEYAKAFARVWSARAELVASVAQKATNASGNGEARA